MIYNHIGVHFKVAYIIHALFLFQELLLVANVHASLQNHIRHTRSVLLSSRIISKAIAVINRMPSTF
jgi:hypothetical protein